VAGELEITGGVWSPERAKQIEQQLILLIRRCKGVTDVFGASSQGDLRSGKPDRYQISFRRKKGPPDEVFFLGFDPGAERLVAWSIRERVVPADLIWAVDRQLVLVERAELVLPDADSVDAPHGDPLTPRNVSWHHVSEADLMSLA